jgi:hypothetical protein
LNDQSNGKWTRDLELGRILENRVLRIIFSLKRAEVTAEWRNMHDEELHSLYSSPNITSIRVIKPRRMKWKHEIEEKCIQHFSRETCSEETTSEILA